MCLSSDDTPVVVVITSIVSTLFTFAIAKHKYQQLQVN